MKKKSMGILLIAGMIFSCSTGHQAMATKSFTEDAQTIRDTVIVLSPADGKSYETAVVINEKTETTGVHAEYQWIRDHYKNYTVKMQSLNIHNKRYFDVITIVFSDGTEQHLYFDISKFFGHY